MSQLHAFSFYIITENTINNSALRFRVNFVVGRYIIKKKKENLLLDLISIEAVLKESFFLNGFEAKNNQHK
jgi:hypothetical protein